MTTATRAKVDVFDGDSHVFEPSVIWDTYLEPEYRVPARSVFWHNIDPSGITSVILNGKPARPMNRSRIIRQAIWRPGMTVDQIGALDPKKFAPINPGSYDPAARLKDMDAMGIRRALLFPTLFSEYFPVVENPDVAHALARAYNNWIADFSKKDPARLLPVGVLPIQDVTFAMAESRRIAGLGFKAVAIRPSFYQTRFLNHPYYDPMWKELEALGLAAFVTPSPGSANDEWTSEGPFVERVAANLRIGHDIAEAVAPLMDSALALAAFGFYGHMEEYPKLKLAYTHSGASWVPLALEKTETRLALAASIRDVSLEPEHVFLERPSLVVFDSWESLIPRMLDFFEEVAAWGSRYPQHDASTPQEGLENLSKYNAPPAAIKKLMGGNIARFLGV